MSYSSTLPTSLPIAYSLGIKTDGTDQTSALQSIFNSSNYTGVIIDYSPSGNITLNGTLNCNNKLLKFLGGGVISGTGTVQNVLLDIDIMHQGFSTGITLTSAASVKPISVKLFGAVGNGSSDDIVYLQRASDTVISNPTLPKTLIVPPQRFKISAPWILYNWNGTDYAQFTIEILGDVNVPFSNLINVPTIDATSITDTFAIGAHRAYGGGINGVYIQGNFQPGGMDFDTFVQTPFTALTSVRNSRYSPYAGIVTDPFSNFSGSTPSDGGYPGYSSWYRGTGSNGGTSGFYIKNCTIWGFAVGIMQSPNGFTQQGEDCIVDTCKVEFANSAIAFGQSQSDRTEILNGRSWEFVWTVIDTGGYGAGIGNISKIDSYNVAGLVNTLFSIGVQKHCIITDFYAESFFQLGSLSASGEITVIGSTFDFYTGDYNVNPQYNMSYLYNVTFIDCRLRYYDDLFNKRLRMTGSNISFIDCSFDLPPYYGIDYNSQYRAISYENCNTGIGILGIKSCSYRIFVQSKPFLTLGNFTIENQADVPSGVSVKYNFTCGSFNRYTNNVASGVTITPTTGRTAIFTWDASICQVNDLVTDYYSYIAIGRISSISGSTISLSEVPLNISAGTYYPRVVYLSYFANPFCGTITLGSANITNAFPILAYLPGYGERIEHPAFPVGTYVISSTATTGTTGATTITVSNTSNTSATKQNFIRGNPEIIVKSNYPPNSNVLSTYSTAFASGTKWIEQPNYNSTITSQPNEWYFNEGGYLSATTVNRTSTMQADFYIKPLIRISGGTVQYKDNTLNQWINA